jgi:ABC-2 type transport system permease protein
MNYQKALDIAIKDIKEVFSSISIYGPMLGVPIFFAIVLPVFTFYVIIYGAPSAIARIASLPTTPSILKSATTVTFMQYFVINVLGPIFLTMPILTATVIAADSFSGEKERKTSEALLATPVKVSEMLLGKILASFIPTVLLTAVVFTIYGYVANYMAFRSFGSYILPTTPWLLMFATSPFLALVAIGVIVLISSKVRGVKEAQQISTLLILPVLIIPFTSILGIATLDSRFFIYTIVILALLGALILYVGVKSFKKESIL